MEMRKRQPFKDLKAQEKDLRKQLVMDAAERLFASNSFERVNMRDIANEVGFSPGSIYTYFPDQESLFIETALRGVDLLANQIKEMVRKKATIEDVANFYINVSVDKYELFRMCQHCVLYGKFNSEEYLNRVIEGFRNLFDQIDKVIESHISTKDARSLSHLFFSTLNGILLSYGRYPGREKAEAIEQMTKLALLFTSQLKASNA